MHELISIVTGLVLLVAGAEFLVRGASRIARAAKISPLIIGLTIVAFGTSAPELAVSVSASLRAQPDIAVGNVIGSNIFNVLFILGVSALVTPLAVTKQLIRWDVPIMIAASIILMAMSLGGEIDRIEGSALFLGIIVYVAFLAFKARSDASAANNGKKAESDIHRKTGFYILMSAMVLLGLAMLVAGSRFLVDGAVELSEAMGVSKLVIALTIVAVGTSLPELATSVVASIHGERDIAVGNIVGSNIFNILAIVGLSAVVAPAGLEVARAALSFDLPIMVAVAIACLPIFYTKGEISRWEGATFLLYYFIYLLFLISYAKGAEPNPVFTGVVLYLVIPFTGLVFLASLLHSIREVEIDTAGLTDSIRETVYRSSRHIKRLFVTALGLTILLIGLALIFLPGPGVLVILLGLAVLGTEFAVFKRIQANIKGKILQIGNRLANKVLGKDDDNAGY